MRTLVLLAAAAVTTFACASKAHAADMDSWSGLHVGVQGGYTSRTLKVDDFNEDVEQLSGLYVPFRGVVIVPGATFTVDGASTSRGIWTYGGQLGYDVQVQRLVLGVEGDILTGSQSVSTSFDQTLPATALTPPTVSTTVTRSARASWTWSARARAGYAVSDMVLLYATGGLAGARVKLKASDTFFDPGGLGPPNITQASPPACRQPGFNSTNCPGTADFGASGPTVTQGTASQMQLGWTVGAGGEMKLGSHLSLGVEYRYTNYGHKTYSFPNAAVTSQGATITDSNGFTAEGGQAIPGDTRVGLSENRVMLRLNWRFGRLF